MLALLSSLSPSQIHTYVVRRMSNQGKITPSVVFFLIKEFQKLGLNHFVQKNDEMYSACAQLVTVR